METVNMNVETGVFLSCNSAYFSFTLSK